AAAGDRLSRRAPRGEDPDLRRGGGRTDYAAASRRKAARHCLVVPPRWVAPAQRGVRGRGARRRERRLRREGEGPGAEVLPRRYAGAGNEAESGAAMKHTMVTFRLHKLALLLVVAGAVLLGVLLFAAGYLSASVKAAALPNVTAAAGPPLPLPLTKPAAGPAAG